MSGNGPSKGNALRLQHSEPAGSLVAVQVRGDWVRNHRSSTDPLPARKGHLPHRAGTLFVQRFGYLVSYLERDGAACSQIIFVIKIPHCHIEYKMIVCDA
jgi:hypothetical protein